MKALLFLILSSSLVMAKIKVAALTPLLADLAEQIGGEQVTVISLSGSSSDPHSFTPTPKTLSKAQGAKLYIASGKGLESFLPELRTIVGNKGKVIELGKNIVSIKVSGDSAVYACCPKHSYGALDPHWWHSIEAWRRASTLLSKELSAVDPANADYYKTRATNYRRELSKLKLWAKKEVASIPRSQRMLPTAHAAFGYFCKEFGFKSIPIQGINKEQSASPQYLAEAIKIIKDNKVKAIFPEKDANTKALKSIAKSTGVSVAPALYGDSAPSITEMFKHNVSTIAKALK